MKKFTLIALASLPALAFAQEGKYLVDGSVGSFNAPAKMYLQHSQGGKMVMDSVTVTNGKFQFSGTAEAVPGRAFLIFSKDGSGLRKARDYKQLYIENGTIKVTSTDTLKSAQITGTKANDENAKYDAMHKPVDDAYAALEAKNKKVSDDEQKTEAFQRSSSKEEKAIDAQDAAVNKKFIQENPDSYISLNALESYAYGADYPEIAALYNGLSPAMKATDEGKKFGERLPKLKTVALGATAPEFAEADTAGKMVSLSSFRGKYLLVDFWASWCGPCRHENPNVVKAFGHYKDKNFTILGVSLDQPTGKQRWLDAIHKDGLTWTQVSDLQFWKSKTADLYAVRAIPQNFLLDPNGKIIGKNLRGFDLDDKLTEIFGKSSKAGKPASK